MKIVINKNPGYAFLFSSEFPIVVEATKCKRNDFDAYAVKTADLIKAAKIEDYEDIKQAIYMEYWHFYPECYDIKEI